jgi:putative SOS response-associated peptidase YedK
MCGRFTVTANVEALAERFQVAPPAEEMVPRFNVAPTQNVPVVLNEGEPRIALVRWGLIPSWAKDPAIGNRMINARAETVAQKPAFRTALRRRRCLVLADGFYEWRKDPQGKTPMYIHLAAREPFAFAGLWDTWRDPDGNPVTSCTLITTAPNELVAPVHNRMPVILRPEVEGLWLDRSVEDPQALLPLLVPYPAELMSAYPVSRRVNSPDFDSPLCIQPV